MKSALTLLLVTVVFAQTKTNSTTPLTVEQTIESLEKSFKGIQADYLQASSDEKNWTAIVVSNVTTYGLSGTISFITSILGVNFLSVEMNLAAPSANFQTGTNNLIYYQVEHPNFPTNTTAARMLQTSTSASGTGDYEGWAGVYFQPAATAAIGNTTSINVTYSYNLWGRKTGSTDKTYYTSFLGTEKVITNNTHPIQLSDKSFQYFTAGNTTQTSNLHAQLYRLARTQTHFPIKTGQQYSWRAGYRYWPKGAVITANATLSGDSDTMVFKFDKASTPILGFSALAILISLF